MTVEAVKELARHKDNKLCFDCGLNGPHQNVCLSYNIFVCTVCAGVHRSFNHIVKTLNMASFTAENVEALKKGGNRRAKKHWLANYDPTQNPVHSDNPHTVKFFIKQCFEEAKWVHKEGDPKKKKKKKDAVSDEAKRDKKKKKKKKKESDDDGHEGQPEGQPRQSEGQPQQVQQHQPPHQQPQQQPDLMDLFGGTLTISEQPPRGSASLSNEANFYSTSPMPSLYQPPSTIAPTFHPSPLPYSPPLPYYAGPYFPPPTSLPYNALPPVSLESPAVLASPISSLPPPRSSLSQPTPAPLSSTTPSLDVAVTHLKNKFSLIRANTNMSEEQWKNSVSQALSIVANTISQSPPTSSLPPPVVPPKPKEDVFADLMGEGEGAPPVSMHLGGSGDNPRGSMETPMNLNSSRRASMENISGNNSRRGSMEIMNNARNSLTMVNTNLLRNPFLPANTPAPLHGPNPFLINLPPASSTPSYLSMLPPPSTPTYLGPTSPSLPLPFPSHSPTALPSFNPFLSIPLNPTASRPLPSTNPFLAPPMSYNASNQTNLLSSKNQMHPNTPFINQSNAFSLPQSSPRDNNQLPPSTNPFPTSNPFLPFPINLSPASSASSLPPTSSNNPFLPSQLAHPNAFAPSLQPRRSSSSSTSSLQSPTGQNPFLGGTTPTLNQNAVLTSGTPQSQTTQFSPPSTQDSFLPHAATTQHHQFAPLPQGQHAAHNPFIATQLPTSPSKLAPSSSNPFLATTSSLPGAHVPLTRIPSSNPFLSMPTLPPTQSADSSSKVQPIQLSLNPLLQSSPTASVLNSPPHVNPFLSPTYSSSIPTKPPPPVKVIAPTTTSSNNPFDNISTPFVPHMDGVAADNLFAPIERESNGCGGSGGSGGAVFGAGDWGDFAASGFDGNGVTPEVGTANKPSVSAGTPTAQGPAKFHRGFKPPPPTSPPPVTFPSGSIPG